VSQQKRKRIEQSFGWGKTIGGLARPMLRGVKKLGFKFTLTMACYNLIHLPKADRGRSMSRHRASETSGRMHHDHALFAIAAVVVVVFGLFAWRYQARTRGTGGIAKLLHDRLILARVRDFELTEREIECRDRLQSKIQNISPGDAPSRRRP
jgi:hypothetical protein